MYYHALVVDVLSEGTEIRGVVIAGKAGLFHLPAKVVIDASGDADVAARMGVPFESSQHGPIQSLSTTFKMINVDISRAKSVRKSELHAKMQQAEQ